jgi:hypothetical protein
MTEKELPVIYGEPPTGYSLVTFDDKPMKPMLWYANAVKIARATGKPIKEFVITVNKGKFTLWVKKRKGEGKMVGRGFGETKELERKKK